MAITVLMGEVTKPRMSSGMILLEVISWKTCKHGRFDLASYVDLVS